MFRTSQATLAAVAQRAEEFTRDAPDDVVALTWVRFMHSLARTMKALNKVAESYIDEHEGRRRHLRVVRGGRK
jgi:hypothetical protein